MLQDKWKKNCKRIGNEENDERTMWKYTIEMKKNDGKLLTNTWERKKVQKNWCKRWCEKKSSCTWTSSWNAMNTISASKDRCDDEHYVWTKLLLNQPFNHRFDNKFIVWNGSNYNPYHVCRNPSFGLVTKVRVCKSVGHEWSMGITFHAHRSVEKCEGMNPYTPKWAPILGIKVPMDSRIFTGWSQRDKTHWIEEFLIPLDISWNVDV